MVFGLCLFITMLLLTTVATLVVVGAWMLPETVLLIRRIAGAKRHMTAAWTGREIPEAYQALTGPLRLRLRTAVRDPGTRLDLRWRIAPYVYGALVFLALPLWPLGLVVDAVGSGLLRRTPVVLPPGRGGARRTAPGGARHPPADPHRPRPDRCRAGPGGKQRARSDGGGDG